MYIISKFAFSFNNKLVSNPCKAQKTLIKYFCGVKRFGDSGPFNIKLKVHVEEEEVSEDE